MKRAKQVTGEAPASITPIASSIEAGPTPCPCGSGKSFPECHGASKPVVEMPVSEGRPLKLDLGAGQSPAPGFDAVDLNAAARWKVNLFKFPWPWADNSVDEIHCSHFVEHIPLRDVEETDLDLEHRNPQFFDRFVGQDMLFAFFDECWRILKPDAPAKIIVPALQTSRAFQDPTHRRFIPQELFLYLNADWRKLNKLDHYRVRCCFDVNVSHTVPTAHNALHEDVVRRRFTESWNFIVDWHASLIARKGPPPTPSTPPAA